jgi:hypothetical protein
MSINGHGVATDDAEPELFVIRDKLTGREILFKPPSKLKFSSFPPQVRPSRELGNHKCCWNKFDQLPAKAFFMYSREWRVDSVIMNDDIQILIKNEGGGECTEKRAQNEKR